MSGATDTRTDADLIASAAAEDARQGWYLYGITRRGTPAAVLAEADTAHPVDIGSAAAPGDRASLQLLECCGLAAVVRPVVVAEFSVDILKERLRDASEVEAMVRSHNSVIEAFHARQAILPAKFGVVYSDERQILSGLRSACDTLLPQLSHLEGCDEWALHLYADRSVVQERIAARIPAIGRLRDQFTAARPGRAYFLERQLRDEMEAATRQAMATLAQGAFDQLARAVVAAQASAVRRAANVADETEILRAAFLVSRDSVERFEVEVRAVADAAEGLRCECSGPWAPYSFAACGVEGAQ